MKCTFDCFFDLANRCCQMASLLSMSILITACGGEATIVAMESAGPFQGQSGGTVQNDDVVSTDPPQLPATVSGEIVRLLPLGDSITQGYGSCSYRTPLSRMLENSLVTFVGGRSAVRGEPTGCTEVNIKHEGRGGWRAVDWLSPGSNSSMVFDVVARANPGIVLLHIGSNDMNRGEVPGSFSSGTGESTDTVANIDKMVSDIFAAAPEAYVYVANIIPWLEDDGVNSNLNVLRSEVEALMGHRISLGEKITVVDVYSGFNSAMMQPDLIHPNASGDEYIARRWLEALQADGFFVAPE